MNVNKSFNVSTPGTLGPTGSTGEVGQLDGMSLTQGTAAPKKSFKTQVKEFFREVGQFFKSLTQRKATVGVPKPTKTAKTQDSGPILGGGLPELDFSKAKSFQAKSSGNGGACFVKLEDTTVVIKGGGDSARREVYGAQLARELGLPAPETRLLTSGEKAEITQGMHDQGVTMPKRRDGESSPVIVMEIVNGKTVDEARDSGKVKSADIAKSFGKWMAFAAFINEPDTFHGLISGRQFAGGGINTANFMVSPKSPESGIVGIDQNVGGGDSSEVIGEILTGSDDFFSKAAMHVARAAGDDCDPEQIMGMIKEGADEVFEAISKMSPDRIEELGHDLGIDKQTIEVLKERQAQISGS